MLTVTFFVMAVSTVIASETPIPTDESKLIGKYQCAGHDPNKNTDYSNPVIISKLDNAYSFKWLNSSGAAYNYGTGFFNKDLNAMSVVFWAPANPNFIGTMLYTVKPDGSLQGIWTIQQTTTVGTENCKKK